MEHFRLLIIGAGASGIAAASRLLENGFSDFRILEAENRIGGRVNTVYIGNQPIELGAEWIHGEVDNIVYELSSKCGLADNSPPNLLLLNTTFFDYLGNKIIKNVSVALCTEFYDIMSTDGKDLEWDVLKGSVGDYFEAEFQKRIKEIMKKLNVDEVLCLKFLKTFENFQNSIDASHSWHQTSLCGHLEYWECEGNTLTEWKNNRYDTIFKLLNREIPNPENQLSVHDQILFNKEVTNVRWNQQCVPNQPNVEVKCLDGTLYKADHVLLTCSLGVLKERASTMFVPLLPEQKLTCIENLGFGTVDKIFVKFKHRWWKEDYDGFAFLWSEKEREKDTSGWLNGVVCFHPINKTSTIMRGWITGEAAQLMETLPDKEILEGISYLFEKFVGIAYDIAPIELCVTSYWYTNPHFRGSYSNRLIKSEVTDVWASQLAEPCFNVQGKPILLFGGEATHNHYFSTVHGAIEAGYREAKRLMPILRENVSTKKRYQVAIVGAGVSGLAAARALFENGIHDIIILEAQATPGGRIRTVQVGEYCLELGAQWIHGDKNEVFTLCQENDLLTNEYSSEGEGLYLRENGETVDKHLVKEVDDVIKNILENCENYASSGKEVSHSIGEELLIKFNEYLENRSDDSNEVKTIKRELFDWHVRFQLIDNSCSDLNNLSAKSWGLFKFCGGKDYVNFKKGYSTLIDTLINILPKNTFSYKTAVDRIEWAEEINLDDSKSESDNCVKIFCNNGRSFCSDYVIVTSSLGYLKKHYKTMFSPSLPNYLSEAIELLDFGVIDKIYLIYKEPWWRKHVKGFQLLWSNEETEFPEKRWGKYLTGFDVIFKDKPVLLGWIGGEGAKIMEQMPEDQLGKEATQILQHFTKDMGYEVPPPEKVVRTQWWLNDYVIGAYSNIPTKCDKSNINGSNLGRPVYTTVQDGKKTYWRPTILLAGECIHKNHFSTVHGAYESGCSQAHVILSHIKGQK